jgi:hypothetical protein
MDDAMTIPRDEIRCRYLPRKRPHPARIGLATAFFDHVAARFIALNADINCSPPIAPLARASILLKAKMLVVTRRNARDKSRCHMV